MIAKKPREDVLRLWLRAADEFAKSPTPHVGHFAGLTGEACWHVIKNQNLLTVTHVVEEIAGARAKTNPDKVDAVLLRSRLINSLLHGDADQLLDECVKDGIVRNAEEGKARLTAIWEAIQRRRQAIGLKGRGYVFD